MATSTKADDDASPFSLAKLNLTPAERSTVVDFVNSWKDHGRPVLFVGAGMSRFNAVPKPNAPPGAEIKDWAGLIAILREGLANRHPHGAGSDGDRHRHGATRSPGSWSHPAGGREADRQPHGATRSPGSWSHFVTLAG